jgi:hypothetical protein
MIVADREECLQRPKGVDQMQEDDHQKPRGIAVRLPWCATPRAPLSGEPKAWSEHSSSKRSGDSMDDTEQLLVTSIDEMIVRAARRLVEQRLLVESLPPSKRCDQRREEERRREVIDRLVTLRKAMISERAMPSASTTVASNRKDARKRKHPRAKAPQLAIGVE